MSSSLESLRDNLQYIASDAGKEDLYTRIGDKISDLIQQEWDTESDPFGASWAPTTRPNPILEDTGEMRGSYQYEVTSGGITFLIEDWKAVFHQYGTSKMVARPMFPEDEIPPSWQQAIQEAADEFMAEVFDR